MKTCLMIVLLALGFSGTAISQRNTAASDYHGAKATLKQYNALYVLNQRDDKKIKTVLRNINNALNDPRLKGKLKIELIVFGDGVALFEKSNNYDTLLLGLTSKGVLLAQCENTIKERKISKDELWPFISYVPSGNGEIIIRHYQGWAIIHP